MKYLIILLLIPLSYISAQSVERNVDNLSVHEYELTINKQKVNNGQTIASIYSPDLVNAQEELFEARKIVHTQPLLFNSAKEKLKNWKLSD